MVTYYLYRLINSLRFDKCGATTGWDKRCRNNRAFHGDQCIITELETMEGPNTPEMWQVVGDREWELADQYGYPRGTHYRISREKRRLGGFIGGKVASWSTKCSVEGGKVNSTWIRKMTFEQAEEIRAKYIPFKYTHRKLAKEYGVTITAIRQIISNLTYTS